MRVVSLVPSHTETLFALGAGDDVVGVTSFCVHPPTARKENRVVGGTKTPRLERIVALQPDVVVVAVEENPREAVEALEDRGLRILVTDVRSIQGAVEAVLDLGEAVDQPEAAEALSVDILAARDEVRASTTGVQPLPVLVPIWRDPWMGFNRDTFANDVLETAGGRNVLADAAHRYPTFEVADMPERGPQAVLLPSEPYRFTEDHRTLFDDAGISSDRVLLLDGEALTWYGARTPWGLREVARVVEAARGAVEE